jgi:hypothetical protein
VNEDEQGIEEEPVEQEPVEQDPVEQDPLEEVLKELKVEDIVIQTVATLINLAARRLGEGERPQAQLGIDAARALLPFCSDEIRSQLMEPLSQLQLAFVQSGQEPAE